jgi:hypothetical protein
MKPIHRTYCLLIALAVIWMMPNPSYALTDTVSGIINFYTPVIAIDSCNATFVVKRSYGFKPGDRVMLIQMKGATINVGDSSSYGDVLDYGNAGNYELNTVDQVNGKTIVFKYRLVRSYDVAGKVQLVRVPSYSGHVLVSPEKLRPLPWDGESGGVVALIADSNIWMSEGVDASGCGFRGGRMSAPSSDTSILGYKYAASTGLSGGKGEGITLNSVSTPTGRGRSANGGGGGNAQRSGGGGGSNYGIGGQGGLQWSGVGGSIDSIGGKGGVGLAYSNTVNKVFLGGGGGGGHQNGRYDSASLGANGGGIVFIRCDTLTIYYSPVRGVNPRAFDSAGAGGGGAGGVMLLDVNSITSGFQSLDVTGSDGRRITNISMGPVECQGPGGGGGSGVVWLRGSSINTSWVAVAGGNAGIVVNGGIDCDGADQPYGATAGTNGQIIYNLIVPEGSVPR